MDKFTLNIGIFGVVSCGKSSFLNAIIGAQCSDVDLKKTTMVPQVYVESTENNNNCELIRKVNKEANETISQLVNLNKFTINQCYPVYHKIDRLMDIFNPQIIDPELKINIYDIPGLNDSSSKKIYFEWVNQNIKLFDIIIFMTDITKGLNNSDEIEILNLLMESMKKSKSKMICLINKCDEIYYDETINDLVFEEKEHENIYVQANNILADISKSHNFEDSNRITAFLPISSENFYIYHSLIKNKDCVLDDFHKNKLCKNEYGENFWKKLNKAEKEGVFNDVLEKLKKSYNSKIMDTGYLTVKSVIQQTIIESKTDFINYQMDNEFQKIKKESINNISNFITSIDFYKNKFKKMINYNITPNYKVFWDNVIFTITAYYSMINSFDNQIIYRHTLTDFKTFEKRHFTLQNYFMDFILLENTLQDIPEYPEMLIKQVKQLQITKLLEMYNQLFKADITDQSHVRPNNCKYYLQFIKNHSEKDFSNYVKSFLKIYTIPSCKHINDYPTEFLDLFKFILDNSETLNVYTFSTYITKILINLQVYVSVKTPEKYIYYLISLKKAVKKFNKNIRNLTNDSHSPFDLLYEIIAKNIHNNLDIYQTNTTLDKKLDHTKIEILLHHFTEKTVKNPFTDIQFETNLLELFSTKLSC